MIYHPGYTKVLTADERMACMRFGAILKCAEHALRPQQVEQLVKQATLSLTDTAKGIAAMAVLSGIPIGVIAHIAGQHISGQRAQERELQEKVKYYRNATQGLGAGLPAQGA